MNSSSQSNFNQENSEDNQNSYPEERFENVEDGTSGAFSNQPSSSNRYPKLFSEQDTYIEEEKNTINQKLFNLIGKQKVKKNTLSMPSYKPRKTYTAKQRLKILEIWFASSLPATEFSTVINISPATLNRWKRIYYEEGEKGLESIGKKLKPESTLSALIKENILFLKESNPNWGCDRISQTLYRLKGLKVSSGAINNYLKQQGYTAQPVSTSKHKDKKRRFERSKPNELWQTDMFTFILKRQNRRVHLVGFMDDNSRFIVGYGIHASASGNLVREVFEASILNYGLPTEILTDNGAQYYTWRGKSQFTKLCERRGVKHGVCQYTFRIFFLI